MKVELRSDVVGDSQKFEFIYTGFIIGGSLSQQKGMTILRREIQILTKLEAMSAECDPARKIFGDELLRELTGGTLDLSKQEFELLISYMSAVPWSTGQPVRDAVEVIDWLESVHG
jgi:hypothetical protein